MKEYSELYDDFNDDCGEGDVVGTLSTSGQKRLGVDVESVISIDNGALRIAPLIEAGFGRSAIAYGPFPKEAGLAFAVQILNGHSTSQAETLPDTFRDRIWRWLKGSEADPPWLRFFRWLCSGRVRRTLRQFRWWKRTANGSGAVPLLNENLAVGWFPAEVVPDPRVQGNGFIMHALGPENGELWIGSPECRTKALRGVQNLLLFLVAVVRSKGIVYYVSSIEGVLGVATYPQLRPVAVDVAIPDNNLYVGIQQGVLGQIGFRLDTRVKGVRVAQLEEYGTWHGGSHAADSLKGEGSLRGSEAEIGGRWQILSGEAERRSTGTGGVVGGTIAVIDPGMLSGMIHAEVSVGKGTHGSVGLVWRCLDEQNHWRVEFSKSSCEIVFVVAGEHQVVALKEFSVPTGNITHRLQVLDDGSRMMAYLDGEPLQAKWVIDENFQGASRVGLLLGGSGVDGHSISNFEAHPRTITVPEALHIDFPCLRRGSNIVVADDFTGKGGDLQGRTAQVGGLQWYRMMGNGVIEVTGGGGARIGGSVEAPCPGRTAYCLDWAHPEFADLEVTITPPGTERGQRENSRAGFILFQDVDNYFIVNVWLDDAYGGASVSSFFKLNGFEDLYDAVWTNVGDRIYWGKPFRLRLSCDGERYLVCVNNEPVLYRAFRDVYADMERMRIRKVGLIANWEWGCDTGSKFEQFAACI